MPRRLAATFGRFVGLVMMILGGWVVVINLVELGYSGWVLVWILVSGALGAAGGLLFLLSFDGPPAFRTFQTRFAGWLGMLVLALLPSSLSLLVVPMLLLALPVALLKDLEAGGAAVSSG